MIAILLSCTVKQSETIVFEPRLKGEVFSCETTVQGWKLTDFRMFLSKIEVNQNPVDLLPQGLWQTKDVALLDFENGSGSCENGDSMINDQIQVSTKLYKGDVLSFDIGVPFEFNHSNPVKNSGPLRNMSMHWSWRSGYKFIRLGANNPEGAHWSFHLGSTQCLGEMTDVEKCLYPNRARAEVVVVDPKNPILLNLDHLLLGTREISDLKWGCMSEQDDRGCDRPFEILGLREGNSGIKTGIVSQ